MTMQPEAEAWMPNGFPPASFVVEVERVSTFSTARGRWLAAAALLGALLMLAGILVIARGGDDNTAIKTEPGTTVPFDGAATFPPSTVLDPTATGVEATTGPTLPVDPNASVPGGAGGPGTTAAAPAAPGPPGAPAAPGVLEAPGNATIPTVFPAKGTSSGTIGLKNTGQGPLSYTSRATSGLSANPGSGTIAAGASATVTLTLDGNGLAEGEYRGSVIFEGSGGVKTVQVTSRVAKPPTITSSGDRSGSYIDVDPPKTPCNAPWRVKARVEDSSKVSGVSVTVSIIGGPTGNSFAMTREAGDEKAGIWVLGNQGQLAPGSSVKFTFKAIDEFGAEATPDPHEETDGLPNSYDCSP